jgi:hypothetical protein
LVTVAEDRLRLTLQASATGRAWLRVRIILRDSAWRPPGFLGSAMKKLLAIVVSVVIYGASATVLAYASYSTTQWGGSYGYLQLEYELTFKDLSGNPIEGVALKVEDQRGKEFFCFPVTDYLPGQTPKSDKQGVMRFHHVSAMVEWDNYGWSLFWLFPIQTTRSPVYVCRFLHGGKEVHRVFYGELPDWDWPGRGWEDVPKVKRQWNWSAIVPEEIIYRAEDTDETYRSRLKVFFHQDDNNKPNREGVIACRNACRLLEKLGGARARKQEPAEDLDFPVIRRTITVQLPGHGGG